MNSTAHQLADYLTSMLPGSRPRRVSAMCGPESADKYRDIPKGKSFTRSQLLEHAGGRATWAATLDADGAALAGAIDVDQGGQAALWAALAAAADLGVTAYAIAVDSGEHTGGHIWCIFDRPYPAAHVAALMRQIADRAQLADAEIWPGGQVIRLPFGQHRRANTRGQLLLPSGELIDLDLDLAAGFAAVAALPRNSAPPAIEPATPALNLPKADRRISPGEQAAERSSLADVRARFNAQHTLEQLLLEYGAQRTPGGYSCPCGVAHTHQTTLAISRQGKLFSYSRRCAWHSDKGWDAFGLYVLVEHSNNIAAALKALNPIEPSKRAQLPPAPLEYVLSPAEQARRTADAQRKRDARQEAAAETIADVRARAATDETLRPTERAVLEALLTIAGDRGWCRPSKERIAAIAGCGLGSVKRALFGPDAGGRLEGRYFVSEGDGGGPNQTAIRTFLRGSFGTQMIPMIKHESDSYQLLETCEGGAALEPQPVPADRGLLGYVRALAKEAAEPGWALRDYAGLGQVALEAEAGRLELLLLEGAKTENFSVLPGRVDDTAIEIEPAGHQVADGASYDPAAAAQLAGDYTGRSKDLAGFETLWRWSNAAIRMRADGSDQANGAAPEQQQLEPAPSSAGLPAELQACPPAPTDPRYGAFAWRWNAAQQEWRTGRQRAYFERQALAFCDEAEPGEAERRWLAFKRSTTWARPTGSSRPPAHTSRGRPAPIGRQGARAAPPSQALSTFDQVAFL